MGLVNDEDLVAVAHRGESSALAEVAGVVDAAVARGVDLDDIEAAGAVAGQFDAAVAHTAGRRRRALRAVQAAGEDACRGGLAAAAGTGEQVGVIDPALFDGGHQRVGDVLLADHVREGLGAVPTVKGCTHR